MENFILIKNSVRKGSQQAFGFFVALIILLLWGSTMISSFGEEVPLQEKSNQVEVEDAETSYS